MRVITTNRYLLIISSLDGKQKNPSLDLLQNSYIEKERKPTKNCHGNIVELDLSANFRAYLEDARGPEPTAD